MDALRSYGGSILRGLLSSSAPAIAGGFLVEMLGEEVTYKGEKRHIETTLITELVNNNDSLWSLFDKGQAKIKDTLGQLGDTSWITADWLILAIKKDYPALSSQFLGWRKAYNWLSRQVVEIRSGVG